MILLTAVAGGLLAGLLRAKIRGRRMTSPNLRFLWLVVTAFILQLLAFNLPLTRTKLPDQAASVSLILSQFMLLVFAWSNRRQYGFRALIVGLALNLLVVVANGGWMPISPETVRRLILFAPAKSWFVGQRFGFGKDVVLPVTETRLWFLSDCLLLPRWFPYRVAFSIGDALIALGAFHALWASAGPEKESTRGSHPQEIKL